MVSYQLTGYKIKHNKTYYHVLTAEHILYNVSLKSKALVVAVTVAIIEHR